MAKKLDIDWSKVWTAPQADRSDWEVAQELGVSSTTVFINRKRLGIGSYNARRRSDLPQATVLPPAEFKINGANGKTVKFNIAIELPADLFKAIQGDMFRETVAGVELIRQAIGKEHLSVETSSEDPLAKRIAEHLGQG